jgi:thiamine monophosphate kinase
MAGVGGYGVETAVLRIGLFPFAFVNKNARASVKVNDLVFVAGKSGYLSQYGALLLVGPYACR